MKKAEETNLPKKRRKTLREVTKKSPLKIVVKGSHAISGNGAVIRKNLAQVRRGKVPEYWTKVVIDDET